MQKVLDSIVAVEKASKQTMLCEVGISCRLSFESTIVRTTKIWIFLARSTLIRTKSEEKSV